MYLPYTNLQDNFLYNCLILFENLIYYKGVTVIYSTSSVGDWSIIEIQLPNHREGRRSLLHWHDFTDPAKFDLLY